MAVAGAAAALWGGGHSAAAGRPQPGGAAAAAAAGLYPSLPEAAQAQHTEAVLEMLDQGHDVDGADADGNTALHWATWFRLEALAERLVERGARVDAANSQGEAAVHWAAKSSNVHSLDTMTRGDRGLLSLRDCDGFTPFLISAQNDNAPVMEWLYLKGISVEEQDNWGRTALQWACYKGHRRTVQWLLSRSASVVHRDHEGMTAIHWAALKGHEQAADMLLDVGAVHLLDVPDAAGDTPIALAMRKKNRFMVLSFHKCQLLQALIGRPFFSRNHFANLFVGFICVNIAVFACIIAPGIANPHPDIVMWWSLLIGGAMLLWVQNCYADPGWLTPRTIFPQDHLIGDDPNDAFDAWQPVESQMAHCESLSQDVPGLGPGERSDGSLDLARLELEQNKLNYQRQLVTRAQRRLDEGGACGPLSSGGAGRRGGPAELQPLIGGDASDSEEAPPAAQQAQLRLAARALRERERAAGEAIGRARVERLLAQRCGDYLTCVERGSFKQVCVVCRAKRRMRSHHCKECGRCVDRLDHHCPWIDNCVGLGNQREFYAFIVCLLLGILMFYYAVLLYFADSVFPALAQGSFAGFLNSVTSGSLAPELEPMAVLALACFDLIWLAFVGALVARQTAYMAVNITTYEVLVRPAHVQQRFPKTRGRFWFLQGLGLVDSLRHCVAYWTLSQDGDEAEFWGSEDPSDEASRPGSTRRSRGGKGPHGASPRYHGVAAGEPFGDVAAPGGAAPGASAAQAPEAGWRLEGLFGGS